MRNILIASFFVFFLNSCASTGLFFQTYETCFQYNFHPAVASTLSTLTSTTINVPLSILKRKSQTRHNLKSFHYEKTSFLEKFKNTYFISCAKKIPKNSLKYYIYESFLVLLWPYLNPGLCGAISSLISSRKTLASFFPSIIIIKITLEQTFQIINFLEKLIPKLKLQEICLSSLNLEEISL